jgi:hypothetical protein
MATKGLKGPTITRYYGKVYGVDLSDIRNDVRIRRNLYISDVVQKDGQFQERNFYIEVEDWNLKEGDIVEFTGGKKCIDYKEKDSHGNVFLVKRFHIAKFPRKIA